MILLVSRDTVGAGNGSGYSRLLYKSNPGRLVRGIRYGFHGGASSTGDYTEYGRHDMAWLDAIQMPD